MRPRIVPSGPEHRGNMVSKLLIAVIVGVVVVAGAGVALFTFMPGDEPSEEKGTDDIIDGHRVVLPEKHVGYTMGASPMIVPDGERCMIIYKLNSGHVDYDLLITINDNPTWPNGIGQIFINEVHSDLVVKVSGVYDMREYNILVPDEQKGYILTTSTDRLHHGQSYTMEYRLLPGYREVPGQFGILVNGEVRINLIDGTSEISDVRDTHRITVVGVEPIEYRITAGKNTMLLVDGKSVTTATVEDVIIPTMIGNSELPSTYAKYIPNTATKISDGYKVTADTIFPSVVKVTVGNNIIANGQGEGNSFFLCSKDIVTISAKSGYSIPSDYDSSLPAGSKNSPTKREYVFDDDIILPSIYKVTYLGYSNETHEIHFRTGTGDVPAPTTNPSVLTHNFTGWESINKSNTGDIVVKSYWTAKTYNVSFGVNLFVTINGTPIETPKSVTLSTEDKIIVRCNNKMPVPDRYSSSGKSWYDSEKDCYWILGDCNFPGITYVVYWGLHTEGDHITSPVLLNQNYVLTNPTFTKPEYRFVGWLFEGTIAYEYISITEDKEYHLQSKWEKM